MKSSLGHNGFNQITVEVINENEAKVYLNLPTFKKPKLLGAILRDSKTFRTVPKNYTNLFHLFGRGIGLNSEIISRFNFEYIEIPFAGDTLRTTRKNFLKKSIPSPYCSEKIDHQRILRLEDFIIPIEEEAPIEDQLSISFSS